MTCNPLKKIGILRRKRVRKIRTNEERKRLTPKNRNCCELNGKKENSSGVTTENRLSHLTNEILLSILEIFIF